MTTTDQSQSDILESYIDAFKPIVSRVRTDVTAIKKHSKSYWTKQPLTEDRLDKHFSGILPRGVCPIKEGESVTRLALLDLDSHKGETSWDEMVAAAKDVAGALTNNNLFPIPFRSSGGRGIHIYIIWDEPQDAFSVRKHLVQIISECGYENGIGGIAKKRVEIFPKQDRVDKGRYGNQFILPLAGESRPLNLEDSLQVMDREYALEIEWKCSDSVPKYEKPIREVKEYSGSSRDGSKLSEIADMLNYIESIERDIWLRVGMAIHYETGGSDLGKELWHEWSMCALTYKDSEDIDKTWDSFKGDKTELVKVGTIRHLATQGGWCEDVSDEFEVLESDEDIEKLTRRFELIPAHQFAKQSSVSWLIKGFLPKVALAMVYGESGCGKTFFVLDICLAISIGKEWRGHKLKSQSKVAYIAAEGVVGIRNRISAYSRFYDVKLEDMNFFVIADSPNLHTDEDKPLIEAIKSQGGADIVVIDTLAQVTPGANENSGEDMGLVLKRCQNLVEKLNCLTIIIHHSGKDHGRGSRGWSGIKAVLDTEIEIKKLGTEGLAMTTKQKDGESGDEFPFKLNSVNLGTDEDGDPITSCVVEHLNESSEKMHQPKGKWQKLIMKAMIELSMFGDGRVHADDLVKAAAKFDPFSPDSGKRDSRKDSAKRAANAMVASGLLILEGESFILPQVRNSPQNAECEIANQATAPPHIPHHSIEVRNCGTELEEKSG